MNTTSKANAGMHWTAHSLATGPTGEAFTVWTMTSVRGRVYYRVMLTADGRPDEHSGSGYASIEVALRVQGARPLAL